MSVDFSKSTTTMEPVLVARTTSTSPCEGITVMAVGTDVRPATKKGTNREQKKVRKERRVAYDRQTRALQQERRTHKQLAGDMR